MAFLPRNGMLPWATSPSETTRNQYTPRCPTHTRRDPKGSGMITASVSGAMRPGLGQPGDPGVSPGLLVHRARDLEGAVEPGARPPEHFRREERGRDAPLHVARPASPDRPVAHLSGKRIRGPAASGGDHVEVTVQMQAPAAAPQPAHDVLPGVALRTRGTRLPGGVVELHLEAGAGQPLADKCGALRIVLSGRVHGGDPDQLAAEGGDLVAGRFRLAQDPGFEAGGNRVERHRNRGYRPVLRLAANQG